jgi:hypothetical protein
MKIWIWAVTGSLAGLYLFGSGLLLGREMPAHHFERFGNSHYLFDTATGRVCDALPNQEESGDPFKALGGHETPPAQPRNADGLPIIQDAPKNADGYPIVQDKPAKRRRRRDGLEGP